MIDRVIGLRRVLFLAALTTTLAACGSSGGNDGGDGGGGSAVTTQEDKFGVQFGKDFRKEAATSEPNTVMEGDIIAIDPTAEPLTIQ